MIALNRSKHGPRFVTALAASVLFSACGVEDNARQGPEHPLPQDIVSLARIQASGTRDTFLCLWPRETDDAPYTVRDKDPATGWKVPRGGSYVLTLDFAPLMATPPLLSHIESQWEQPPEGHVCVRARAYCGGEVLREQEWADVTTSLLFDPHVAAYCVELFVPGGEGKVSLSELNVHATVSEPCSPIDGKTAANRIDSCRIGTPRLVCSGVVEGFYGRPWSHAERLAMVRRLGDLGLGIYIYGPKYDPLHRDTWRIPYEEESLRRFAELLHVASSAGVTLSFGISPGKDMIMDDPAERAILTAKLEPFVRMGFTHFTLLLDDIETDVGVPIDAALAEQHVSLANWLRAEMSAMAGKEVSLWLVPTVYSTHRQNTWSGGPGYLDVLARLDPGIEVMWTGTDTLSRILEAADLVDITTRIGRRPVLWENQHATDGGDGFVGKVYCAPYMKRSADLVSAVKGIVANPMILGAASRLVLGSYASFLRDPANYDPAESILDAAGHEATDPQDLDLLLDLANTFYGSGVLGIAGIALPVNPAMERAIQAFQKAVGTGSFQDIVSQGSILLRVAARMATAQNDMHHSRLDVSLVDDFWVPADRLAHEGKALLHMLDWFGSILAGFPDLTSLERADSYLREALFDRYQLSLFRVNTLRAYLVRHQPPSMGFVGPEIREPLGQPRVGIVWEYVPSPGASVAVYGLPGSRVEDDSIVWTPSHAGTYNAVVIATSDTGWSWRETDLVVGF